MQDIWSWVRLAHVHDENDSQDHSKLHSDMIAETIRPLVEIAPFLKVKSIITEVLSRFNYNIDYRKA
ncbi:hypothetical protein Ahy_B01g055591 isoform B [Arachis hypogaea]|uniref:Uncharacterized protein n=1 Tax=Arachis hypogaea TaxID=3818 RepID=A0A445AWQ4_ARAHY|nr:hypothetical protein Ahy_B01g055591 isoform B [Arachis hypogaea]